VEAFELPEREGETSNGGEKVEMQAVAQWTGVMGFSRDEVPWVGPVPRKEGVFVAAGYTGHGMPNTWLSGKAVAEMVGGSLAGGELEAVVEAAREKTGLPKAYQVSVERIGRAMQGESVEVKDHAELSRSQRILETEKRMG